MGGQTILEVQGELWISTTDPCNEVIFERPYGEFGRVAAVDVRGRKLEVYYLGGEVQAEELRGLVVEAL